MAKIGKEGLDGHTKGSVWTEVRRIAREHSFFHWDLELPDIFYDESGKRKGNPGFDVVVGNPPWISTSADAYLNAKNPTMLNTVYDKMYRISKTREYYAFFFEKSLNMMKINGRIGYIVALSAISLKTKKLLQKFLVEQCSELKISSYNRHYA